MIFCFVETFELQPRPKLFYSQDVSLVKFKVVTNLTLCERV